MKKLLTITATVFLTIFTAGMALASTSATTSTSTTTSPFPATFNSGALYFVNSKGAVATDNGAGNKTPGVATITINQAKTASSEPAFFYGTFATDLGVTATSTNTNTFTFTATLGDDGYLHITGNDTNGDLLRAVCKIGGNMSTPQNSAREEQSINLRGAIITAPGSDTATTYSFAGALSK